MMIQLFLKVDKIQCIDYKGNECDQRLVKILSSFENTRGYVATRGIDNAIKNDILTKKYSVRFAFPNILFVLITKRDPKYAMQVEGSDWIDLVDEEGYITDVADNTFLPILKIGNRIVNPGDNIDKNVLFALKIVKAVSQTYIVNNAKLKDDNIEIILKDGYKVIFPNDGDFDTLLGSFKLIVSRLNNLKLDSTIENNKFREIDLRYKNPVIR